MIDVTRRPLGESRLDSDLYFGCDMICIDFSGTLVDLVPRHVKETVGCCELVLGRPVTLTERRRINHGFRLGMSTWDVLDRSFRDVLTADMSRQLCVLKRARMEELVTDTVLSGHPAALRRLEMLQKHCRVAIVTLGLAGPIHGLLRRAGLGAAVDVFGRNSHDERVEKGSVLLRAISGAEGARILYIGDTKSDGIVARRLGLRFIRAGTLFRRS